MRAYLITPGVDNGHIDVVHENGHTALSRWTIGQTNPFLHVRLDDSLKHIWRRSRRKVEALKQMLFGIVGRHVALDHDRFGCALFANQQYTLLLLRNCVDEKCRSSIVNVGHQNARVLWHTVRRINKLFNLRRPMGPIASAEYQIVEDHFVWLFLGPSYNILIQYIVFISHILGVKMLKFT